MKTHERLIEKQRRNGHQKQDKNMYLVRSRNDLLIFDLNMKLLGALRRAKQLGKRISLV
jgi:hypothetical protein